MKIGEKIKTRRLELGWSLQELADRMGYANKSSVARIESGTIDPPQSKVVKFAEVLHTSVAFLMDWEETQKKNDVLSDIVLKMNEDAELLSMVEALSELGFEQREAVKSVLYAFSKAER